MPISMHQACVPIFRQTLAGLSNVLDKAEAHCRETDADPSALLASRLAPDMFTLAQQVQRATFHACQCAAQLAGAETPTFDDDEDSIADLRARIASAIAFVSSFAPDKFDGSEERMHHIPTRVATLEMTGQDFLRHFALPQFFFHVTTAYDLIRHAGVEVGKRDYLGSADDR